VLLAARLRGVDKLGLPCVGASASVSTLFCGARRHHLVTHLLIPPKPVSNARHFDKPSSTNSSSTDPPQPPNPTGSCPGWATTSGCRPSPSCTTPPPTSPSSPLTSGTRRRRSSAAPLTASIRGWCVGAGLASRAVAALSVGWGVPPSIQQPQPNPNPPNTHPNPKKSPKSKPTAQKTNPQPKPTTQTQINPPPPTFLCHDISVHVPHHVNSKIPWYNLRKANESLKANWGALWLPSLLP